MGWIARSQLASAVSRAGACGIIETSSGELDIVKGEIARMRELTDRPFGVNIAQAFVRDPSIVEFVIEQGVKFVTTSAGSPTKYTADPEGRRAHRVPRRADAGRRAEGGRRRRRRAGGRRRRGRWLQEPDPGRRRWCCCRWCASRVDVPIIAAGGIIDGATMAAAFALGAEGVQMGTRMVSAAESPVHDNWKQAIVAAAETDTVFLNAPLTRACGRCAPIARRGCGTRPTTSFGRVRRHPMDLYFGGDMEAGDRARPARWPAASTACGRWPTSSPTPSREFGEVVEPAGRRRASGGRRERRRGRSGTSPARSWSPRWR